MMSFYFPYNNLICGYWWRLYNISHYKSSMMGITVPSKVSVNWPVALSINWMTTLESNCMHLLLIFTLKSTKKIKNTFRQTLWIHFSNSQLPIPLVSAKPTRVKIWQLVRYVSSIVIFWTKLSCWRKRYSNKDTLL